MCDGANFKKDLEDARCPAWAAAGLCGRVQESPLRRTTTTVWEENTQKKGGTLSDGRGGASEGLSCTLPHKPAAAQAGRRRVCVAEYRKSPLHHDRPRETTREACS